MACWQLELAPGRNSRAAIYFTESGMCTEGPERLRYAFISAPPTTLLDEISLHGDSRCEYVSLTITHILHYPASQGRASHTLLLGHPYRHVDRAMPSQAGSLGAAEGLVGVVAEAAVVGAALAVGGAAATQGDALAGLDSHGVGS